MIHHRTKIICTIGPAVRSIELLGKLVDAGMNVGRINFSHGTHEEHKEVFDMLKEVRADKRVPLAILLDTKGPEIRVCKIQDDAVQLQEGQKLRLVKGNVVGDEHQISINPESVVDDLKVDMQILFDDGYISGKVVEVGKDYATLTIDNTSILKSNKGVNIPHGGINLPPLTEQDILDIKFGAAHDVDYIAASFVQSADAVLQIRELLEQEGKEEIKIISKIESASGVENFDAILQVSDGIMVARGDLGVELPLSRVPQLQKQMIRKSYHHNKFVVTATQMLESMISNARPTRAEASDVANAIYDSTSAVMLSGETAVGKHPITAVKTMRQIAEEAEAHFEYRQFFNIESKNEYNDISTCVALASVKTAYSANAKSIFAYTSSGFTARMMSRFRPKMPIIALTQCRKTYHQLALSWGVVPLFGESGNMTEAFEMASCNALKNKYVHYGDLVVVSAGNPFGITGTTNMMVVENIGDVLVRGTPTKGEPITANVVLVLASDLSRSYDVKGKVVLLTHCDETFLEILRPASGIILQNLPEDVSSEKAAKKIARELKLPCLVRADGAAGVVKEGKLVTLDPQAGLVFKGLLENESDVMQRFCRLDD
jgi:pyruvate kinase